MRKLIILALIATFAIVGASAAETYIVGNVTNTPTVNLATSTANYYVITELRAVISGNYQCVLKIRENDGTSMNIVLESSASTPTDGVQVFSLPAGTAYKQVDDEGEAMTLVISGKHGIAPVSGGSIGSVQYRAEKIDRSSY